MLKNHIRARDELRVLARLGLAALLVGGCATPSGSDRAAALEANTEYRCPAGRVRFCDDRRAGPLRCECLETRLLY